MAPPSATTSTSRPEASRHWALFADWCTATGRCPLPATPDTVLVFLAEFPTGAATTHRRLVAIDAAHHSSGLTAPGASPPLTSLLHPAKPSRFDPDLVADALRNIPVGGWPTGIVGRRDAALVALIASAGKTRLQVQALRCDPDGRQDGSGPGGMAIPEMATSQDPGSCPACALTRWQRVAATISAVGWRAVRNDLADLGETPAGTETVHDCTRPLFRPSPPAGRAGRESPLFCAIDRHGAPESAHPLSIRSITTIVTTRLAPSTSPHEHAESGGRDPVADNRSRGAWGDEDRARVKAERKAATDRLASLESILDEADAYVDAILQRLDAGLSGGAPSTDGDGELE